MLTQPAISQLLGGSWQPLQRSNWNLATQTGNAVNIATQLRALGVADAKAIDMTDYVDADGNFHDDVYGSFQYLDPITRFYGIMGTLVTNAGTPQEVKIPIYECAGRLWDRQTKPVGQQDKIAPIVVGGNQNPFPNGAYLKIQSYPQEGYATLYWDFQP